jgi:hypothetical protein
VVARERAVEKIKSLGMSRFFGGGKDKEKDAGAGKKTSLKGTLVPKRSGPAGAAELIKMKKEAKGDEKVPADKRVYLYTEAEARSTTAKIPRGVFWYSKVSFYRLEFTSALIAGHLWRAKAVILNTLLTEYNQYRTGP